MNLVFQMEALNAHNKFRELHGAPPLVLCAKLAKSAEKYARELAKSGTIQYSMQPQYGENIACIEGCDVDGEIMTELWYKENSDIQWENLKKSVKNCNNFTQLIWVDSINFGIAKVVADDKKAYIVARYWPPGNYRGKYATNVLPRNSLLSSRSTIQYITRAELPDVKELKKKMLGYINRCRDTHGVPNLKWSDKITNVATKIALRMANSQENSDDITLVEDIYGRIVLCCENGWPPLKKICQSWYDCCKLYNYSIGGYSEATGAFTQLIWKNCKTVGVGFGHNDKTHIIVACFEPPGNITGKYDENIKPLSADKKHPFAANKI